VYICINGVYEEVANSQQHKYLVRRCRIRSHSHIGREKLELPLFISGNDVERFGGSRAMDVFIQSLSMFTFLSRTINSFMTLP